MNNNEFIKYRKDILSSVQGGIITPNKDIEDKLAPFDQLGYKFSNKVNLGLNDWQMLCSMPVDHLIDGNPIMRSDIRQGGFKSWDAAVAIPASTIRRTGIINKQQLVPCRATNTYWTNEVGKALKFVGPINNLIRRPMASQIVDLREHPDGWEVLEAAHVLAHIRGDPDRKIKKKFNYEMSYTREHFKHAMAEIIVGLLFDLPINVGKYKPLRGAPNMPYQILVIPTTEFKSPYLILPWKNEHSLVPDETLAVINVALHIEPYPGGFVTGSGKIKLSDRWCCSPSIVNIVGWDTPEFITHQNVINDNYIEHYADLMPPNTLNNYLDLYKERFGVFKPDNIEWFYVQDWLNSSSYAQAYMETPPLPCRDCLLSNFKTDAKPERPKGYAPKKLVKPNYRKDHRHYQEQKYAEYDYKMWHRYEAEIIDIMRIIEAANLAVLMETTRSKALKVLIKLRKKNYLAKLKRLKLEKYLEDGLQRIKKGTQLTMRQAEQVAAFRKRTGSTFSYSS